ncbi:MAG: hypothetical protein GY948_00835 [Alphaproteobacteria bacterium]|nr:hypothetical protein [Alphaproteobacteria bacterium]
MRNILLLSAVLAMLLQASVPTVAGPMVEEATKAEGLVLENKAIDAIIAMDSAVGKLWNVIPLTFVDFHFVTKRPTGYGDYEPRPNNVFKPGEDMIVYVELAGYDYKQEGKRFKAEFSVDMEVRSPEGKVLGSRKNFLQLSRSSRVPNREFFAVVIYTFDQITKGKYAIRTFVTDKNANDKQWFQLDFEVE